MVGACSMASSFPGFAVFHAKHTKMWRFSTAPDSNHLKTKDKSKHFKQFTSSLKGDFSTSTQRRRAYVPDICCIRGVAWHSRRQPLSRGTLRHQNGAFQR
eukprot:TRINITY_DN5472_c0_g1_i1.p3 TRINITY_DN5472_c0_g1~~TRINITY_DN5472_c0_g1_i1.p3  ORF type:complete len:100 (-),score=1.59 TRINITY_DN5472_c0_g1_i1:235-534(-)